MELNRAVAENIKRIRKSKKLSLERTAALSGVSRSMLSQIERGEANPSVAILGKLAEALKVPAEILLENDDFISLLLSREPDNIPKRLDGGKVLLRPSMPYDGVTRQESFFLDLYISAHYRPELAVPGCVCHATVMSGTVSLTAENQEFQLMERDALRFAADALTKALLEAEEQHRPAAAGLSISEIGGAPWRTGTGEATTWPEGWAFWRPLRICA